MSFKGECWCFQELLKRKINGLFGGGKSSYPQIFENSPDILLFVIDLKGVIVNVRGGSNQLIGLMSKILLGKSIATSFIKKI